MKIWFLALLASTVIVVMTAGPASAVTKTQVKAKTLSLSDMPIGWSMQSPTNPSVTGCLAPVLRYPHLTTTKVQFAEGGNLPELQEEVATSKSLSKAYSTTITRLDACHSVSGSDQGTSVTASVGALSYPHVGNESAAFNVSATVQGVTLVEDFVVLRWGPYVAAVLLGDEDSVDTSLLQGFVTEAIDKIEGKPTTPPATS